MATNSNKRGSGDRPITVRDLGKFTDEVILPGVGRIVDDKISPLRDEMKEGFNTLRTEMRRGFADLKGSIRFLAGEIAELKTRDADQKHEERISRLEHRIGLRQKGD